MNKTVVLVVEDDRPIRNLIVTTLKMHDYKYLTANNGVSAIMEASSHHPDIVLLDLGLPDMEGVDVIKKIRTWSNMPIIVISARSEDSDKIEALDSGADDYITKPFSVEELLARKDELEALLKSKLVPKDPRDDRNVIVEIRAGTGGDEAGLFVSDLLRMYLKYAELHHYKTEILSANETGIGGYKEVTFTIKGKGAYSRFKFESGVHRVQRVP